MANPPFNVDEIDADKVKSDLRLPFGLPGVNKKGKVSNGNYVWISYFYSYLNEKGRAGFVMSSQASSAGGGEAKVRQKLVETADVDVMIAIRSNFFYTRTVPCELWFLNRDKPESHRNKVLMLDARNVYRKVTRKIYDFSPEQQQNLVAIVWLYRGQTEKYLDLVSSYCRRTLDEGAGCFKSEDENGKTIQTLPVFAAALDSLNDTIQPFLNTLAEALPAFHADVVAFQQAVERLSPLAESSRDLREGMRYKGEQCLGGQGCHPSSQGRRRGPPAGGRAA
jgi:type I restriction enzyme M protein